MPHKKILWNLGTFFFLFMQIALIVIVLPVTNISDVLESKKSRAGPGEEYRYKVSIWANAHVSLTLLHNSQLIFRSTLPPLPPPHLALQFQSDRVNFSIENALATKQWMKANEQSMIFKKL